MIFFELILWVFSTNAYQTTSNYLEETSECVRYTGYEKYKIEPPVVSCHTFKEFIAKNHAFVDKSLLLREVFKDHTYLTVFYLPPKFAKTINLDMIRTFAEIELDSNHSILARNHTFAYNYFALGKILNKNGTVEGQLRNPPLISRHVDLIDQHLAQHPSIYFNLYPCRTIDFGFAWSGLKDRIGDEFARHRFLTSRISINESSRFIQLFDYFNSTKFAFKFNLSIDLSNTVIFLAEMTTKFFQKKPILYIDGYDSLLSAFLCKSFCNEIEEERILTFFNQFIETVFSREDIWHRIVVTGTHSVHSNMMSSLPGTKAIYHAFDNNLSHFFGFTEIDLQMMSKHFPSLDEKHVQEMREYYKGYQMGHHYPIYNPACVMNFFTTKNLTKLWPSGIPYKSFTYSLWGIHQMRYLWLDLLSDQAKYMSRPFEKFSLDELTALSNVLGTCIRVGAFTKHSVSLSSEDFTRALMYQVDMGYLTLANYEPKDRDTTFHVRAANLAIRKTVFDDMRMSNKWYEGLNVDLADKAIDALHSYLFSRQREQYFDTLTRSFGSLFDQTKELFEENSTAGQEVSSIGRRIIEYIGLRLEYQYDHKVDRKITGGFVATKLNVSSVIIFNFNQSVANEDILNQMDNYTHPWTQLGPQSINSSVTYFVIGVKNGTEICTRRYGAEPPIVITTKAPILQTTAKKQSRKQAVLFAESASSRKRKNTKPKTHFQPKDIKPLNATVTRVGNVTNDHTSKLTTDLTPSQGSKSTSQSSLNVVNPVNGTYVNEAKFIQAGNSTTKESSLKEITRVARSIPIDQSSSTVITSEKSESKSEITTLSNKSLKNETTITDSSKVITITSPQKSSIALSINKKSKSGSNSNSNDTKSLNQSFTNKIKITNSDTTAYETTTLSNKLPKTETTITDSSKVITITSPQKSSIALSINKKSKSGSNSNSNDTKSLNESFTNKIKITNSDTTAYETTTLSNKLPKTETTITDSSKVITITSPQKSSIALSIDKKSKSGSNSNPNDTKSLNESFTNKIKTTNFDTTAYEKNSKITRITPVQQSQPNDTKDSTISTQTNSSNSTKPKTRPSKSGSKSNPKGTRPYSNSTFSKNKKGKNFNGTTFVRGNSTKFTKFARGRESLANKTTITGTPTTTQSTTTEITVDTYFPTFRNTRPRIIRRSRTGSKVPPKSTSISRIKFLKLFFNVRG